MSLENEELITVSKALDYFEQRTGDRPAPSTFHRWRKKGCSGVVIETLAVAGKTYTSLKAIHRFWEAVTEAKSNYRKRLSIEGLRVGNLEKKLADNREAKELGL